MTGQGLTSTEAPFPQLLDELLDQDEWTQLAKSWTEQDRQEVNLFWHQLDGKQDMHRCELIVFDAELVHQVGLIRPPDSPH